jgi:putative flippase GtrA
VRANGNRWRTVGIRWLKFNAVGGIGIGVQLAVLAGLKSGLHLDYLWASGLAVEAAVIHNFVWHGCFTWAERQSTNCILRFAKFNLTTGLFSILGNLALMKLLVEMARVPYLAANGITIAACSVANFLLSDRFVFQTRTGAQPEPAGRRKDRNSILTGFDPLPKLKTSNSSARLKLCPTQERRPNCDFSPDCLTPCGCALGAPPTRRPPASARRDRHGPSSRKSAGRTSLQRPHKLLEW